MSYLAISSRAVAEPGICGWIWQIPGSATGCCCATKGVPPVLSAAAAAPAAPGRRPPVAGSFVLGAAGGWWSVGVGLGQVAASPDAGRRAGAGEDAMRLAVAGAGREPGGEPRASINRGGRQGMRGINRQAAATGSDGTEEILNTTLISGWMWI